MAIKSSGQLSFTEIVAEFADTAPYSMSEFYRNGGKVPSNNTNVPTSGAISFSNFYNAVNIIQLNVTYSVNTTNASININSLPGYVAGLSRLNVTINPGIYVYSTSTAGYGLNITGGTTGDTIYILNQGYILGMGGTAQNSTNGSAKDGESGGPALNISIPTTIEIGRAHV